MWCQLTRVLFPGWFVHHRIFVRSMYCVLFTVYCVICMHNIMQDIRVRVVLDTVYLIR